MGRLVFPARVVSEELPPGKLIRAGKRTTEDKNYSIMTKKLIKRSLALLATLTLSATAQARIGYSLTECRTNYGHEVKTEVAWCGGTAYSFKSSGLYLYAIIGADGKVNDIIYFDNRKVAPLSAAARESLWKLNQGDKVYDNFDLCLWNSRKQFKRLGQEHGEHWVEYSWDGKEGRVMNSSKKNGFQIRSLQAFKAEQKSIQAEAKGQVRVGAITESN